jgi:hypothetical protein
VEEARGIGLGPMDNGIKGVGGGFPNGIGMGPCVEEHRGIKFIVPRDKVWVISPLGNRV